MKTKSLTKWLGLAILPAAMAFTSCIEDKVEVETPSTGGVVDNSNESLLNATYSVGGGDQARALNLGYWSDKTSRAYNANWEEGLSFEVPAGAVNLVENQWSSPAVSFIPADYSGSFQTNLNDGAIVYNLSEDVYFTGNINGKITIYNSGNLKWGVNSGQRHTLYNAGTLTIWDYANVGELYNVGDLILDHGQNPWWPNEGGSADIPDAMTIYSNGGSVTIPCKGDWKAECYIDDIVYAEGYLNIQNDATEKHFCGIVSVNNDDINIDSDIFTSFIKTHDILLNGNNIYLTSEGYITANKLSFEGNGKDVDKGQGQDYEVIKVYESSIALVDVKEVYCKNDQIADHLGIGVYANFETITYKDGGTAYTCPAAEYPFEIATQDGINNGNIGGVSKCGGEWGVPSTPQDPRLDEVVEIESPTHNHNSDKDHRHLSATSLAFDENGNIYASFHMRGYNWANDQIDKDAVEGCIEHWNFDGNAIEIGNWMWTNEFDFNHILLDGSDLITVGHKDENGAIIGRVPASFTYTDVDNGGEDNIIRFDDFEYKYLTTEVPVYGPSSVEGKDDIIIDYQNAGDANCVIRVGDNYYFAASRGYGMVDTDFKRVKDSEGKVLFTSTPGSAKYLVNANNEINVLYLNERTTGGSLATTSFGATLAKMSATSFPMNATTSALPANVSPVDGKNVIAVDGSDVYACLSNGGLAVNDKVVFQLDKRPVNGVAVDEKYIYVANGSYITVLDKATYQTVVERSAVSGALAEDATDVDTSSANFVVVKEFNGKKYVFVAFGQDGVKVYHFVNC